LSGERKSNIYWHKKGEQFTRKAIGLGRLHVKGEGRHSSGDIVAHI